MKAAIKNRARELGFDDCRVTEATPPHSATQFWQWLAHGQHGEMAYMERNVDRRVDPQRVLPGAKSVITLAVAYSEPQSPKSKVQGQSSVASSNEGVTRVEGRGSREETRAPFAATQDEDRTRTTHHAPRIGLIARYARYEDYHKVLGERLKALTEFVNQLSGPSTRSLWYVDTGPLLERDLAQRAGLGFIGKHTNLISRRLGNWIFLAEIITTLELEPDAPEKNRCGSCARCIAACPTGAITAPFKLDARRCISYLTIELKGPIPIELRPAIGNRIYGCDDCLAVCPWNRFAREGQMMKKAARPDLVTPDLVELLSLDEAGFKRRFEGTPMMRTKRRGLLRNVCVALGNVGDEAALPALRKAAGDREPLIVEHARWAMERIAQKKTQIPNPKI